MPSKKLEYLSISQLYDLTGKDRATIAQRLKDIEPIMRKRDSAKTYEKTEALTLIFGSADAIGESLAKERRAKAEAEKAEILVSKLKGELVSVDSMKSAASELVKTLYTRTVRVFPSVIAQKIVGKEAIEVEAILREGLADIFNELKTLPSAFLSVEDPAPDEPKTPEQPPSGRLGNLSID